MELIQESRTDMLIHKGMGVSQEVTYMQHMQQHMQHTQQHRENEDIDIQTEEQFRHRHAATLKYLLLGADARIIVIRNW